MRYSLSTHHLIRALCASVMLAMTSVSTTLIMSSPAAASGDVPLAVIRFNQTRVFYEQQLFKAVSAAVRTKPNVMFDVVSFIPKSKGDIPQSDIDDMAQKQAERIISSLKQMNINDANIHFTKEHDGALRDHEVQIYVR